MNFIWNSESRKIIGLPKTWLVEAKWNKCKYYFMPWKPGNEVNAISQRSRTTEINYYILHGWKYSKVVHCCFCFKEFPLLSCTNLCLYQHSVQVFKANNNTQLTREIIIDIFPIFLDPNYLFRSWILSNNQVRWILFLTLKAWKPCPCKSTGG